MRPLIFFSVLALPMATPVSAQLAPSQQTFCAGLMDQLRYLPKYNAELSALREQMRNMNPLEMRDQQAKIRALDDRARAYIQPLIDREIALFGSNGVFENWTGELLTFRRDLTFAQTFVHVAFSCGQEPGGKDVKITLLASDARHRPPPLMPGLLSDSPIFETLRPLHPGDHVRVSGRMWRLGSTKLDYIQPASPFLRGFSELGGVGVYVPDSIVGAPNARTQAPATRGVEAPGNPPPATPAPAVRLAERSPGVIEGVWRVRLMDPVDSESLYDMHLIRATLIDGKYADGSPMPDFSQGYASMYFRKRGRQVGLLLNSVTGPKDALSFPEASAPDAPLTICEGAQLTSPRAEVITRGGGPPVAAKSNVPVLRLAAGTELSCRGRSAPKP